MIKSGNIKKISGASAFLLLSVIIIPPFYIFLAQQLKIGSLGKIAIGPGIWQSLAEILPISIVYFQNTQSILDNLSVIHLLQGLGSTFWSIALTILMFVDAAGLGQLILKLSDSQINAHESLLLGAGLGLGMLGIIGYVLGATGLANPLILILTLLGILTWVFFSGTWKELWTAIRSLMQSIHTGRKGVPSWIPLAVGIILLFGFILALLPPTLGFDSLSYHLPLPERLLADKRIVPYDNYAFWFPNLIEGSFTIALGLWSERTAQLIHWSFALLVGTLIWEWSHALFGKKVAWWSLAILVSMPSLPWLSSWAYSDMALTFFGMASLYAIWKWGETHSRGWLFIAGIFAGFAMSIKYTIFILPLIGIAFIFVWEMKMNERIVSAAHYSIPAFLTAFPWYLRTWLIMGNPFYPFVFGGRYWDSFRADWYTGPGTGIGLNIREFLMLPINIMLGYRDSNYFDGHIGPLIVILAPFAAWVVWQNRRASRSERNALFIISAFAVAICAFWTFGVIQTTRLWQTRYLWPGLVPFTIPIGLAITNLSRLDLPRLKISRVATMLCFFVIATILVNTSLGIIAHRPFPYITGLESRESYLKRTLNYAYALDLVKSTPPDSSVYFLFEPRSYNMERNVQSDMNFENLPHAFYLYGTAESVLEHWQQQGYSHVLVRASLIGKNQELVNKMTSLLTLEAEEGGYLLYSIPRESTLR